MGGLRWLSLSFIIVYFKGSWIDKNWISEFKFFFCQKPVYYLECEQSSSFCNQCIKTIKNISLKNDTDTQSINKKSWILTRLAKDSHLRCLARINKEWYNMYFSKINIDYLKKSSCCFKKNIWSLQKQIQTKDYK